jgi:transposase
VLEASGNSFQVVRTLAAIERKALVLESCQRGKLKEAHANNDKISAVRIGKAYLAGTAKTVWVPDAQTQERRDWFHAHRKAVKRTTQMRNRLLSYLSDQGVRLPKASPWPRAPGRRHNCANSRTGRPANGRSSKGCSWNCAMPTSNGTTGAV